MTLITIPGKPIPLKRPRFSRFRTYDDQAQLKEELSWIIRGQIEPFDYIIKAPVSVKLSFFMPFPKTYSQKKQTKHENTPHKKRPDIDNLIKFYLDICQGVLFQDDSQVYTINATKIYSQKPRTEIRVTVLGEHNDEKT